MRRLIATMTVAGVLAAAPAGFADDSLHLFQPPVAKGDALQMRIGSSAVGVDQTATQQYRQNFNK